MANHSGWFPCPHGLLAITDATWATLSATYDAMQMLDLLTTIGGYRMVSMALNTLGMQLEPGAERFPALPPR